MKNSLLFLFVALASVSFTQEVFKSGKKYGVSRFGGNPENDKGDTLMFRAEFDEIVPLNWTDHYVFKAKRDEEWSFLTANKLVNQQRYENITVPTAYENYAIAFREGYIDVYSIEKGDFLIRTVKATTLQPCGNFDNPAMIVTHVEKDLYGLINIELKKEILKCEYTKIYSNQNVLEHSVIGVKEGVVYLYQDNGELIFKLSTIQDIFEIEKNANIDGIYDLKAQDKKAGTRLGYYYPKEKWFIEPIYADVMFIEDDPAVAIVESDGKMGLYFEGKQLLACEWDMIVKGDKQGTLAIVTNKKGNFYVYDDGKLTPKTE